MNFITKNDLMAFMNKYVDEPETEGGNSGNQNTSESSSSFDGPQTYVDAAMEMVKDYLGYDPEQQTYTQTIKGDDGYLAALQAMPVGSITALTIDGVESDPASLEVDNMNYVCFKDNSVFQKDSRFVITFTAGWQNVPEIIRTTALQIASLLWESAGGNLAVSSTSFADTGSRVFNNFTSDRFLKQIAKYKRYF